MKNRLFLFAILFFSMTAGASDKDSTTYYNLPDSLKAYQFFAEINVGAISGKKEIFAGIKTDVVKISLEAKKTEREVVFEFPESAAVVAKGLNADASEKGEIEWNYNWTINETYKLLIATAADSAENFSLYSGYIWLPKENKWKLIGTCKINGRWNSIQQPASFYSNDKNAAIQIRIGQVWCQRTNNSWKNLKNENLPNPVINLFNHIDSVQQRHNDIQTITNKIVAGQGIERVLSDGVYYQIMKEGTGRKVSVDDTVTVFYKGYLFVNDSVFDQTKDKPAIFPLKRLIKGWQIGLSLCKVGGKIKFILPSDMAYSIRTRGAKIPPNSILVFEVEVLDAKSPQ